MWSLSHQIRQCPRSVLLLFLLVPADQHVVHHGANLKPDIRFEFGDYGYKLERMKDNVVFYSLLLFICSFLFRSKHSIIV